MLDDVKNYLRIDADNTDDDEMLSGLIEAAKIYIANSTGKVYDDKNHLMRLCVKLLVSHWYTNRSTTGQYTGEYNHSISALMNHIELCGGYADNVTVQP
jgi:uncharacterized phage protein (predicted DNA packaging)